MGFPPGVPISIGAVEACGDGLHAFLLGPDGGGATRCVCGRLQYTGVCQDHGGAWPAGSSSSALTASTTSGRPADARADPSERAPPGATSRCSCTSARCARCRDSCGRNPGLRWTASAWSRPRRARRASAVLAYDGGRGRSRTRWVRTGAGHAPGGLSTWRRWMRRSWTRRRRSRRPRQRSTPTACVRRRARSSGPWPPDARTRWDTRSSNELLLLGAT